MVFDRLRITIGQVLPLQKNTLKKSTAGKASRQINKELFLAVQFSDLAKSKDIAIDEN